MNFDNSKTKGLIIAYYLSRCDRDALDKLGYDSFRDAFISLGELLNEKSSTVKNWRDEFDPYCDNPRAGWYQRALSPSRKEVLDYYENYSDEELFVVVQDIIDGEKKDNDRIVDEGILINLHELIKQSSNHYSLEFEWQEVELNSDFKKAFSNHLSRNGSEIEFYQFTSVITTSSSKLIYVPNQWFAMASYAVGVFIELQKYKKAFCEVASILKKDEKDYAKHLRENASDEDKDEFISAASYFFSGVSADDEHVAQASKRLWRFANDYSWWSGKKTIDRGDFHYSVILNMLNLVNASQGYVAEIVDAYASNETLRKLSADLCGITKNQAGITYDFDVYLNQPKISVGDNSESYGESAPVIIISQDSVNKLNKIKKK